MKHNETELSAKSQIFLKNLRVYLFSSGKNSDETEDIVEELEVHLLEAEKKGKPIEKIVGSSPKEYMEQLSSEMPADFKSWFKYILIIIFGAFSFTIADDLMEGTLSYSLLELIGHAIIGIIFIVEILTVFKYVSGNNVVKWKEYTLFFLLGILPMGMFVGLIYLNRAIETPVIHFGTAGSIIVAVITAIFLIALSWWAKTWVLPSILTLLILPKYLLGLTAMSLETQLILSTVISYGGIGIYLFIVSKMGKVS